SADYFEFTAQANRTASVAVTALDEAGQPTETKLLPVIGIWELSDESAIPPRRRPPRHSTPRLLPRPAWMRNSACPRPTVWPSPTFAVTAVPTTFIKPTSFIQIRSLLPA